MYLSIDLNEMKKHDGFSDLEVNATESAKGDICHYDIKNVKDKKAEKFFIDYCKKSPSNLYICCDAKSEQLSIEEILDYNCKEIEEH